MATTKLQKRLWYLKNKNRILEKLKEYRIKNKDKIKQLAIAYYPIANKRRKERRHRLGISKRYIGHRYNRLEIPKTKDKKEYNRLWGQTPQGKLSKKINNKAYRKRMKCGGKISMARVQLVYEDNIKRYGTLTCYLCLDRIPFGKDHLEHRIPLSRGGTNEYANLAISCQSCNCKKHDKTEEEYRRTLI